jgi:phenylalanyl-tRNA synthetase beta chain
MKLLHSWLAEFVDLDGLTPDAVGEVLSSIGLCCDDVIHVGHNLDGIVVARVLELAPHPDADRIQIVQVDRGDGEALQICCGAFNMAVGDLVPLATLGTVMPGGLEIARRKLRGEWSNGMLCSAAELELDADASGILILASDLVPGTAVRDALGLEADVIYDLDLTPNRPDAWSVIGVARDLAAALDRPFRLDPIAVPTAADSEPADTRSAVRIEDPDLCGRFTVHVFGGVTVGVSDAQVARRLTLVGMRPINSIVDASNYVMLETGQPTHCFDLATVPGGELVVRRARAGEQLVTLDGQTRDLSTDDGVICDAGDRPIALAGVMGGASTEISESTTEVLFEAAWWDPQSTADTGRRHQLRSEASIRFEKGVDPEIAERAAARFAQLLGLRAHPGTVRAAGNLPPRDAIVVRPERVNRILGTQLSATTMAELLAPIGFAATQSGDTLVVDLPSWRPDSTTEIDVVEEIARRFGYGNLPLTVPSGGDRRGGLTEDQKLIRVLARTLAAQGLAEAKPMPFLAPGDLERFGVRSDAVTVTNPLDAQESVLRTSTLPGLVNALGSNAAHRNTGVALFEIGHCWAAPLPGAELPQEWNELGVVVAGADARRAVELAHMALHALDRPGPTFRAELIEGLHPTRSARILSGAVVVGEAGEVDPHAATSAGVSERVAWLRLDLDAVLAIPAVERTVRPVSRFPSSDIDLAVVLDDAVPTDVLVAAIAAADPLVSEARLFDVFRSEAIGAGKRSLAVTVRLQADDRTLVDAEAGRVLEQLIAAAENVGGTVRRAAS